MFGLFNDEGCVEDDFCTFERAQVALANYSADDDLHISEICETHPEHEKDHCELCNQEMEDVELSDGGVIETMAQFVVVTFMVIVKKFVVQMMMIMTSG